MLYKGSPARALQKKKHPKFSEIEAIESVDDPTSTGDPPAIIVQRVLRSYVNSNRLAAVASKLAEDVPREALLSEFADDVWDEFWTSAPAAVHTCYSQLTPEQVGKLEQFVVDESGGLLR